MKINAKIAALAGAALLMGSAAFAQATDDYELPQGFAFSNEVASDLVEMKGAYYNNKTAFVDTNRKNYQVEFAGITDKVSISYTSEKFWFELAPKFGFKDYTQHWQTQVPTTAWGATNQSLNNDDMSFSWDGLDWGVRFTPFDIVDFWMNTDVWTTGSYLPVADEHIALGNLQGDGVGIVFKPIDGLRIALEVPFSYDLLKKPNYVNAELEDDLQNTTVLTTTPERIDYRFKINFGVDYKLLDMITVGATVHNILNRDARGYGLYANAGVAFLDFSLGYSYNAAATKVSYMDWDNTAVKIGGRHKANIAVTAAFGDFTAGIDALFNFFKTQSIYDLYAGLKVAYDLLPGKFNIALRTGVAYDMGNKTSSDQGYTLAREQTDLATTTREYVGTDKYPYTKKGSGAAHGARPKAQVAAPMVELNPNITYTTGNNVFQAGLKAQYWLDGEGSYAASFPVSWKYNFN